MRWMSGAFVLALVMACGLAGSAFAAGECAADSDCPEGFSCQAAGGSACAVEIGPDGEPVTDPNCQPETYYACVPPPPPQCDPAQLSADCPSNQVCVTYTYEACSGGGSTSSSGSDVPVCDPSTPNCPEPTPTECTTSSESYCVPRYFAPCQASADCGPGFDCVEDVYEVCSGTRPDSSSSSGSDPLPPDEGTCETQSSGVNYCRLQEISCDNGQVCPEGLVCETYDTPSTGTCSVDPDGNEVCTDPEPSTPVSVCVPADWSGWFATAEDATGSGSSSGSIGENYNDAVGASTGQDGTIRGAEAALPDSSSSSGGTSGATSGGGNTSGGSSGGNADGGGNSDDDGCQVSSTRGTSSMPWASLGIGVGLLLAARGLRRRRA